MRVESESELVSVLKIQPPSTGSILSPCTNYRLPPHTHKITDISWYLQRLVGATSLLAACVVQAQERHVDIIHYVQLRV